jgi:hypothetical protein
VEVRSSRLFIRREDLPVCGGELVGAASRLLRLAQMGACGWGQPSRTAYGQTFAVVKLREEAERKTKDLEEARVGRRENR